MASLTSNPIKDQLTAWCIRTDIVDQLTHALIELGVDTIEDFSFMETSDIDTFCNDQQLRMLDRRKLRNGYDALIASTASSSIAKSTTSISTAGQSTASTAPITNTILRVPEDCATLKEALDRCKIHSVYSTTAEMTVIQLSEGQHTILNNEFGKNIIDINVAVQIKGQGINKTSIKGQINVPGGLRGKAMLESLTLTGSSGHGLCTYSQLDLTDVVITDSKDHGLFIDGAFVNCKNVAICNNGSCGIYVQEDGNARLSGDTSVFNNCTKQQSWDFELYCYHEYSKIIFADKLTKESVSSKSETSNWGGNWGGQGVFEVEE